MTGPKNAFLPLHTTMSPVNQILLKPLIFSQFVLNIFQKFSSTSKTTTNLLLRSWLYQSKLSLLSSLFFCAQFIQVRHFSLHISLRHEPLYVSCSPRAGQTEAQNSPPSYNMSSKTCHSGS